MHRHPPPRRPAGGVSLLLLGVGARLGAAALVLAVLWLAVAWSLLG